MDSTFSKRPHQKSVNIRGVIKQGVAQWITAK